MKTRRVTRSMKTNAPPRIENQSVGPRRHGLRSVVRTEATILPFLDLPLAARTQIFKHILAPTGTVDLKASHMPWTANNVMPITSILRACRTVHNEATVVLYGSNKFIFGSNTETVQNWIAQIGLRNAQYVSTIRMDFVGHCDHKMGYPHAEEYTHYIDALRLAPNCVLKFEPHVDETTYPSYLYGCKHSHNLRRIELTLWRLRNEPCFEAYQRLNLLSHVYIYESGRHGLIYFKTHDSRFSWKEEFLLRDPPGITIKEEPIELDGVAKIELLKHLNTAEELETIEFMHERKVLSHLPAYLITEILNYVVSPPRLIEMRLPPQYGGIDAYATDTNFVMAPEILPFPRGMCASKQLLDQALRMYYTRNKFIFRFQFTKAKVDQLHNLEYVFAWMEKSKHRKHARQVRVVLDFGRAITLHEICISLFARRPAAKNVWDKSLDILFCFKAGGTSHGVSMDQVARNISRLLYSEHDDPLLDGCWVDGYGNAHLYTKKEKRLATMG